MREEKRFIRMLLPYLPRYWKRIGLAFVSMSLMAATNAILVSLVRLVLDQLFESPAGEVASGDPSLFDRWLNWVSSTLIIPFADTPYTALVILAGLCIVLTALKGFFDYSGEYLSQYVTQGFLRDFRNDLFQHISRLSLDFFSEKGTGSIMSRVVNDVELLGRSLLLWSRLVSDPLQIVGLLAVAFSIHARLTLIAVVVFPFAGLAMARIGKRIQRARKQAQEKLGEMSQGLSESFASMRIVQLFCAEEYEQERFQQRTQRLFNEAMKIVRRRASAGPIMEGLGALGIAAILLLGGYFVTRTASLNGKEFVNLVIAIGLLYQPIKHLSKSYNDFQQAVAAGERVLEVYEIQPKVTNRPGAVPLSGFERDIVYDHVSFSYDGGQTYALRDLSLRVPKGAKIALVGPSGAGKSTLMDLLARFYDVTEGAIRIDGNDIRQVTLESLRRLIAVVPQEVILFNDTIAANIAYGRPEATQAEIETAARQAFAHEFIMDFPRGYQTVVGERGTALSGGQCQRLAIARALLKNAPILILDEATSALDAESETLIRKALGSLIEQHTTFIIAHRLSTVRHANVIVALDQGRLVGQGTHEELLATNPLYQKLHRLQYFEDETSHPDRGGLSL